MTVSESLITFSMSVSKALLSSSPGFYAGLTISLSFIIHFTDYSFFHAILQEKHHSYGRSSSPIIVPVYQYKRYLHNSKRDYNSFFFSHRYYLN